MLNLISKQFIYYRKVWFSIFPIFFISGLITSGSFMIIHEMNQTYSRGTGQSINYVSFLDFTIFIALFFVLLLVGNAISQCIDLFDRDNDVLLLIGASPRQLSRVMTGQILLLALVALLLSGLFTQSFANLFIQTLKLGGEKPLSHLRVHFSFPVFFQSLVIQILLITIYSSWYYKRIFAENNLTLYIFRQDKKQRYPRLWLSIVLSLVYIVLCYKLFVKPIPNAHEILAYNKSMSQSMNILLTLLLLSIVLIDRLIIILYRCLSEIANRVISMQSQPLMSVATSDLRHYIPDLVRVNRPIIIIALFIGNFVAMFLNTKLLIDGNNANSILVDLMLSLVFIFGAPALISCGNIITSMSFFSIRSNKDSSKYYLTGCTPKWILSMKSWQMLFSSIYCSCIIFLGNLFFIVPMLRVTILGGGDISKANWSFNFLIVFLIFVFLNIVYYLINYISIYKLTNRISMNGR